MTRFRRTFILATLIGLALGFVLQRTQSPRLGEVGTGFPYEQRLPSLTPTAGVERLIGTVVDESGSGVPGVGVTATGPAGVRSTWSEADGVFALEGLSPGEYELHLISVERPGSTRRLEIPAAGEVVLELAAPWAEVPRLPDLARAPLTGRVDDLGPGGAAGYEVVLTPTDPPQVAGLRGQVERRVTVASDGTFAIDDLAIGDYRASLLPPWGAGGSWPRLVTKGWNHAVDGGELRLPGASASITGRVVDREGRPLAGALVTVRSKTAATQRWPSAESDLNGKFGVGAIPGDDSYEVTVRAGRARHVETVRVPALRRVDLSLPPLDPRAEN